MQGLASNADVVVSNCGSVQTQLPAVPEPWDLPAAVLIWLVPFRGHAGALAGCALASCSPSVLVGS